MDENQEKRDSCCSSKETLLPKGPTFKRSLTLTLAPPDPFPVCEDNCCQASGANPTAITTEKTTGRTIDYRVHGMDCPACAVTIEKTVARLQGVSRVQVNYSTGKMEVVADEGSAIDKLPEAIKKLGYTVDPIFLKENARAVKKDKSSLNLVVLTGALLVLGFVGSYANVSSTIITLLYVLSILIGGYKPTKSAFYAVKSRSLDMNVLMTSAVIGAAAIGQWLEGAAVVWLFALGNVLQTKSIDKTRNSIRSLMDLAPLEAWVKSERELRKQPVEKISVGQTIIVKPGEKIPLDGEIVDGESSVNQAPITGESIPVDKQAGDAVYAGTLNEHGTLEIRVTKLADDTTVAKIIRLVEEAQEQKAPTQAFVDKFARIYTPIVFAGAFLVMILPPLFGFGTWVDWFYKGLELLVVACPCALVISTPVAIVSAIGNAAKNGVLIKGGAFLEIAGTIQTIAFDKTGTLTEGRPTVSQIIPFEGTAEEVLSIARTLEEYSTHPIAKAVVQHAIALQVTSKMGANYRNMVGKGVQATIDGEVHYAGNAKLFEELDVSLEPFQKQLAELQEKGQTLVLIGTNSRLWGLISVADTVRQTTVQALLGLKRAGVEEVIMLTGDNEGTARTIAALTGVSRYFASLIPEGKVDAIKQVQAEGRTVAMVGDGINDAPALATADLGIAMGGAGTDTAMETADVVLMADNLEKLPHTIKLSRKALHIIKQNIWFSLIIKLAALVLIFPDILTLWLAVLSDTGAALIVILNSMRLLGFKLKSV